MFDFDEYDDYRYDSEHYSSSRFINRSSSSRTATSVFRTEHFASRQTQEEKEKDFTQIILGWRLSTVREMDVGASSSPLLQTRYSSKTTYYDRFLPLILEDARASVVQGLEKRERSFSVTIKENVNKPRDPANPWIMNLEGKIPDDQEHSASMNVLVLSHRSGKEQDMVMLVLASELFDRNEIKAKFILDSRVVDGNPRIFRAGSRWQATYVTSLISHQRMYEACTNKASPNCLTNIVNGRILPPPNHYDARLAHFTERLNASQQHAVQRFVATPEGVVLLQGPPGTGKTTTIVQLLAALLKKGERVLVCAPSNKAVQVLAERFVQKYSAPVILAGIESKVPDLLRPVFLHSWLSDCHLLLSDHAIRSASKRSKRHFLQALENTSGDIDVAKERISTYFPDSNAELFSDLKQCLLALKQKAESFDFSQENSLTLFQEQINQRLEQFTRRKDRILTTLPSKNDIETRLLNQSRIIFSTLSVAGRSQMLDTDVEPVDVLIVDEAGQSVEAETLIAFQHMPKKVLLVGDTKQLPATVLSELAKQKGFDRSMMERLEQNNAPQLRLDTQYRMHADISEWPSNQYYDGELVTDASVSAHTNTGLTQSVAFYDIFSSKERTSGTSRQNDIEANYVIEVIRKLRETDKTSRIGVITFYAAQLNAIQALLKREATPIKQKVTVNTVDGFQGDEREVIILSCVCANGRNIGFLNDARRLNVSITRAKDTMVILGHARTLESVESDIKIMIADLRRRNKYFTQHQLDGFLGKVVQEKASNKKAGKATDTLTNASISAARSSVATASHGLFGKKGGKSTTTSAILETSTLVSAMSNMAMEKSTKRAASIPSVATSDIATTKNKGKKQPICRFFNGEPSSCHKGDTCKFVHVNRR